MKIIIVGNQDQKIELFDENPVDDSIMWVKRIEDIPAAEDADAIIDLLFNYEKGRIDLLQKLSSPLIIINCVIDTLTEVDSSFVRINGWPTFLKGDRIEASALDQSGKEKVERVFEKLNKKIEWTADIVGFITPRIVSMIINEALLSEAEKVSSKEQIDVAMKLGTSYPFGPFEWAGKIGLNNILQLMDKLHSENSRYLAVKDASIPQ